MELFRLVNLLYGEGKPEEELLVMEGQIAGLGWLLGGAPAPADFWASVKLPLSSKFLYEKGEKQFGGAHVCIFKDSSNVIFFWCPGLKTSEKCFHKKTEN